MSQGSISQDTLDQLIEFIGPSRILPAEEWLGRVNSRTLQPEHVCLTFDDSLLCQYELAAPVLENRGVTAFFFVYTSVFEGIAEKLEIYRWFRNSFFETVEDFYETFFNFLSRWSIDMEITGRLQTFEPARYLVGYSYLSDEDKRFRFCRDEVLGPKQYSLVMEQLLEEVNCDIDKIIPSLWMKAKHLESLSAKGHIVGLHSHTHPTALSKLSVEEQKAEYKNNSDSLRKILGVRPVTMSHPNNSYSSTTLRILRSMGVECGFCATPKQVKKTPLEFPRINHVDLLKQM
jgi:peptidoglycan/xylan/chitin deacetylase (PgdA/CDA1 family)